MSEYKSSHKGEEIDKAVDRVLNLTDVTGLGTDKIMNQKAVTEKLYAKVDKIEGKGLSSNDFTTEMKNKLSDSNKSYLVSIDRVWSAYAEDIYMQIIPVNGIKETDTAIVFVETSGDENLADRELEIWNRIKNITVNNGSITVYVKGKIPGISIKIRIKT